MPPLDLPAADSPALRSNPSPLSLFARIEAELRQRILSHTMPAGSKLPSEAELEREFGVSRITVRQALAALDAGGLIRKVNGKGSFVTEASDAPRLGPLTGFYEHMRKQGREARGRLVSVRRAPATSVQQKALGVAAGELLSVATVLRLVDGRPLAVGTACGPHETIEALVRADLEANDTMSLLEARLGHRLKSNHIEASAIRAGKLRARQLGIDADDPVLRISFVPYDMSDRPLIYSEMFFRGDAFSYRAVVKR